LNGIFGIFNLDGSPAAEENLCSMQEAMAFWGAEGASHWRSGEIGLGCQHLASTPEAAGERLPMHHIISGLTFTAGARLDNRLELLRHLGIREGNIRFTIPDSEIILLAYQKWGEDCVTRIDGDWHFAVWDERAHKLFLARDPHGNTGLYYYHGSRFFAFASTKKALLALDAIPKRPNLLRISQVLTAWPGDGILSGYEDILRLPPAHRMTITPGRAQVERYWFPEHISELKLKTDEEYVEAFLDVFTQAVSARLRSQLPVGVTLSGGLDSGSVAAVAAGILRGKGKSLTAFTSAPLSDPSQLIDPRRNGDETQLAQATAHQAGNVEHIFIRSEGITPMAGIKRMLWVHDEPGHAAGNQFWIAAILEAAHQRGLGTILTGQMGNATISWSGTGENLWSALLGGDIASFWRVFEKARATAGLGRWRAVRRFLLKPVLWPLWQRSAALRRQRGDEWQEYSAIHPDFARKMNLSQLMAEDEHNPRTVPASPLQHRLLIIQPGRNILGASWLEKGSAFGLEVRDPTQDRRLIELCLAIPEAQFQRNGMDRWLIRRAMQGYLPELVRLNTRRGLQAADLGRRVLEERSEVYAALNQLKKHELASQILDLPRMADVLASMERGLNPQNFWDCNTILLRGLMAGMFLLRF
jgi:asparagine synthase (glutamine-hydrolysing)